MGELASPAPLPSGERPSFKGGGTPASSAPDTTTDDVLRLNTGWQLTPEQWRQSSARRAVLKAQTERLADALESQGVWVRKLVPVVAVASVTGEIDWEESYRAICFLPLVAQRERRATLNALRWYQKHSDGGEYLRYAVVTAGCRIPAWGDLRGALNLLHRNTSRWAHEADRDWNVEIVYRGTELTRDRAGTYHPHANVLYRPRKRMNEVDWSAFLAWSRNRLGAHWRDNGRLASPDEAIKYPFKPADLEGADSAELVWLWWETHRMKFSQPMGGFAAFRKRLKEEGRKVVMVKRRNCARLEIVAKAKRDPVEPSEQDGPQENAIICRTAPQFRFGPFAQPVTLVANFTEHPRTLDGIRRLSVIRQWNDQARAWWDANGAPEPAIARAIATGQVVPFNVHTRRPTVQQSAAISTTEDAPPEKRLAPPGEAPCSSFKGCCSSGEAGKSRLVPLPIMPRDEKHSANILTKQDLTGTTSSTSTRQDTQVVPQMGHNPHLDHHLPDRPRAGAPASGGLEGEQ